MVTCISSETSTYSGKLFMGHNYGWLFLRNAWCWILVQILVGHVKVDKVEFLHPIIALIHLT
jgi:hypothetical protein